VAIETPRSTKPRASPHGSQIASCSSGGHQPVFSFKLRGAYNKIVGAHPKTALKRGVIAGVAGPRQGVALSRSAGMSRRIVMPVTTPRIKVDAVVGRGAEVCWSAIPTDEASGTRSSWSGAGESTFVTPTTIGRHRRPGTSG